jgi:hypothetical protein
MALSALGFGQIVQSYKWVYKGSTIDSAFWYARSIHGLTVTPDGNLWVQSYTNADSILQASTATYRSCRVIRVYTPAGSQAAFSPIKTITVSAATDTLYSFGIGMTSDYAGNILAGYSFRLYKLNYTTGAGMAKMFRPDSQSVSSPAATVGGDIILGTVFPDKPVLILDGTDLSVIGNAIDSSKGFTRSINVSADGNDIYYYSFADKTFFRYHSANSTLGPYAIADTLLRGLSIESSAWNPKDGYLYVSSGGQVKSDSMWTNRAWYAFDPVTKTVKDSIIWNIPAAAFDNVRPRAIAFSRGGDTAYCGAFSVSGAPGLVTFVRELVSTGVTPVSNIIPTGYNLDQNFPNPFNPSTEIQFSVPEAGMTRLVVYDMLGREVRVLVNEFMNAGTYKTMFMGNDLSSGIYLYVMTSGNVRMTKKMVMMK